MGWFVKEIVFQILLLQYAFSHASSEIAEELLLIDQLTYLYNYESIAVIVNDHQDRKLQLFLKNSLKNIQIIDPNNEEMLLSSLFGRKNKVYFSLLNEDDLTFKVIDKVLQTSSEIFSKTVWFIKVKQKSAMVKIFGNRFKFDSNVNILSNINENITEITEVYSVKQNNDNIFVKTNTFGFWSNKELGIDHPYIWDRRTNLFGTNLRSTFLPLPGFTHLASFSERQPSSLNKNKKLTGLD